MYDEKNAQEIRDKQKKLWYEKFCKEMLKGKKLKMKPYKMGYSNDTLAYRKKVKDIY